MAPATIPAEAVRAEAVRAETVLAEAVRAEPVHADAEPVHAEAELDLTESLSATPHAEETLGVTEAVATGFVQSASLLDQLRVGLRMAPVSLLGPGRAGVKFAANLARKPQHLVRQAISLADELGRVGLGRSEVAPARRDRRFADPAWTSNPVLHRLMQAYLVTARSAEQLVAEADLEWRDAAWMNFVVENLVQALAPSNNPALNPLFWKALTGSKGGSVVQGIQHLAADMSSIPRVPSMVEADAFELGTSVAATPGAVVLRTPVFELIQYTPQTPTVRTVPLLVVPPTINKFYILDLAPERSLVEHLVREGQQVFMVSWRNPDARHRDWGTDTYGQAILQAREAVQRITGAEQTHLLGLCSGGILASMVLAHLAATGRQDAIASLAIAVSLLDQDQAGMAMAALDRHTARAATAASAARGFLDGRELAQLFAWLRPGDLIWNYWVNNYLQGRKPPPFDILFWNADTTRMPARLHRDYLQIALDNALTHPGASTMLDSPVDLSKITVDSYVVAGVDDHICPWQSCYTSTQLFGGNPKFVLSTSGHVAAVVNPPGNAKATYRTAAVNPADPAEFLAQATTEHGSWWSDYSGWLGERSGALKPQPGELGGGGLVPMEAAPGTYVLQD